MKPRIDFHRVFEDFATLGMTGQDIAERIGYRALLVQRLATGEDRPRPLVAARIVALWIALTGKPEQFLPRTTEAPKSAAPDRKPLRCAEVEPNMPSVEDVPRCRA